MDDFLGAVWNNNQELENGAKVTRDPELSMELVGDERQDTDIICNWIAQSYGQTNRAYHEAYSREILRQIREQLDQLDADGSKKRSWF